jgi:hypothetical protein
MYPDTLSLLLPLLLLLQRLVLVARIVHHVHDQVERHFDQNLQALQHNC